MMKIFIDCSHNMKLLSKEPEHVLLVVACCVLFTESRMSIHVYCMLETHPPYQFI